MSDQSRRDFLKIAGAAALAGTLTGCATAGRQRSRFDEIPRLELTRLPTLISSSSATT